jgi:hypothetical protein
MRNMLLLGTAALALALTGVSANAYTTRIPDPYAAQQSDTAVQAPHAVLGARTGNDNDTVNWLPAHDHDQHPNR